MSSSRSRIIWSIRELTECLRQRQLNEFDANIGISGRRGNGKSTIAFKIFNSFKKDGFKQRKHQVYSREDVMNLLSNQSFSFCWDDEAINSGYKRDFQQKGQNDLIKLVTNYRDNFNIYCSALPFFYTLDKGLRELIFLHIHVIERGFAVLLMPLEDPLHAKDPWDADVNMKIETKENKRIARNPDLKFRYHKLTTFAGYIYFGNMSPKQKRIYKQIKQEKRAKAFENNGENQEKLLFTERVFNLLMEGRLTKDGLLQSCILEGQKYSSMITMLNQRLKNKGEIKTVKDFFMEKDEKNKSKLEIESIVPEIS